MMLRTVLQTTNVFGDGTGGECILDEIPMFYDAAGVVL